MVTMPRADDTRHKTVQALSMVLLEEAIVKLEAEGWRRVGTMALARPVQETQPPYWVQTMSRNPFSASNGQSVTPRT